MTMRRISFLLLFLMTSIAALAQQAPDSTNRGVQNSPRGVLRGGKIGTNGTLGSGSGMSAPLDLATPFSISAEATLGASVGGAKDIGYARGLINAGQIPKSLDFSPEGLFSEHDIPTPATDCNSRLCLSLGYGLVPTADDQGNALMVHLGMGSNIKVNEFKRPALQLCVVIDQSGSMEGGKMEAVKTALKKLLTNLTDDDELTLVRFDDRAYLLLPATRLGRDRSAIIKNIESLRADNGTNIESGLTMGYDELVRQPTRRGAMKRLILFTDEQPNIGRTDSASFVGMILRNSKENDIGFTLFGIGFDFGQDLAYKTSQARGANFFFLEDQDKIAKVFDEEFNFLVTPIVYDLKVTIATPAGMRLKAVYGLPTWKPGDRDAHLEIPTVFFSSNRGAIVLRYERDDSAAISLSPGDRIATGTIGYTTTDGKTEEYITELRHAGAARLMPGTSFYTHDGMRMVAALTNVYFGLRDGCKLHADGKDREALEAILRAKTLALLDNLSLNDKGIADEIVLLDKLSENIEKEGKNRVSSK